MSSETYLKSTFLIYSQCKGPFIINADLLYRYKEDDFYFLSLSTKRWCHAHTLYPEQGPEQFQIQKNKEPTHYIFFCFRYQYSKAFVITTWRSGSTFLSAYLNSHPGSFNHVEPLNYLKVSRINENQDSRADKAINVIKNFINCKYDYAKSKLDT